ncbi:MAG TPA: hypothetical protein VFG10_11445 [Saprospiraceae bacterium]|nr:hypothetical protein [Saprospiraceae bacterium]
MKYGILFLSLVLILSCRKEKELPAEWPFVETLPVEKYGQVFVFHGNIINLPGNQITERGFIWSVYSNPNSIDSNRIVVPVEIQSGEITAEKSLNLIPGQKYYCKAYLLSDQLTILGNQVSFNQ